MYVSKIVSGSKVDLLVHVYINIYIYIYVFSMSMEMTHIRYVKY